MGSNQYSIDRKSLIKTFLELVKIESPSLQENKIINFLLKKLKPLGLKVIFQKQENTGNIIAILKGKKKSEPLFFNAHFDTVKPCHNINPIVNDTLIKTDGKTILGGDDKAALAIFFEGIKYLKKSSLLYPDIYFVLTFGEELGLIGAKHLNYKDIKVKHGYCFDANGLPGTVILSAATHYVYTIKVHGKAAHVGVEPEKGINAIKIASELIKKIRVGKLDYETTANVGVVNGGVATNIVPDLVEIKGEVRSRNNNKLTRYINEFKKILDIIRKQFKVKINSNLTCEYKAYKFDKKQALVKKFIQACLALKIKPVFKDSNGGSDANILNQNHRQCINCGIGMSRVHSTDEFILIKDLIKSTELFLSLVYNW